MRCPISRRGSLCRARPGKRFVYILWRDPDHEEDHLVGVKSDVATRLEWHNPRLSLRDTRFGTGRGRWLSARSVPTDAEFELDRNVIESPGIGVPNTRSWTGGGWPFRGARPPTDVD